MTANISVDLAPEGQFEIKLKRRWCTYRVNFDGKSLTFINGLNTYAIPIPDIRAIACMNRGAGAALELVLNDGALRVFKNRDAHQLQSLADEITTRLNLPQVRNHDIPKSQIARAGASTRRERALFGVTAGVILLAITSFAFLILLPAWQSQHWPSVPGRVIDAKYEERETNRKEFSWKASMRYTYTVDARVYECDRIAFGAGSDGQIARDIVLAHPTGSAVDVAYDPKSPGRATLVRGADRPLWVILGAGVFFELFAALVLLQRSTPAQDSLLRKYKAKASAIRALRSPAILKWSMSESAFEQARRISKRRAIWSAARLIVVSTIVIAAFWYVAGTLTPALPLKWVCLICFAMAAYMAGALVFAAYTAAKPPLYEINNDGILRVGTKQNRLTRWTDCCSFEIESEPNYGEQRVLLLHQKAGVAHPIALPGGELDEQINAAVASHLPYGPPPREYQPLRRLDFAFAMCTSVLFVIVAAPLLARYGRMIARADAREYLFIAMLLLGPGTISMVLIPRRARSQKFTAAALLNLFAFVVTMIAGTILDLRGHG
jgi:hypothetical protein